MLELKDIYPGFYYNPIDKDVVQILEVIDLAPNLDTEVLEVRYKVVSDPNNFWGIGNLNVENYGSLWKIIDFRNVVRLHGYDSKLWKLLNS